ncbi:MAG: Glucokinase (EC [uncultured Sulfurovum sp.]|uniref:Glucokinase n=1 Tax=uncultured Sulfurovum sp. TaxID=269237 RepID=A0A6S6UIR3_9BACT|nr:MAG: Glucokinase (EC [uncultured Sulfurovum sp.]
MILAGDIGGTKTNLALFELVDNKLYLKEKEQFKSNAFSSFAELLKAFEAKVNMPQITSACFGVAGPVVNGNCSVTNLAWTLETEALQDYFKTSKVKLLNDLEATAYGMLYLKPEEFVALNDNAQKVKGNCAVIAAGTGLGEGMLYYDGTDYHPIASEGGHSDFAPINAQQDALLQWLRTRYPEHVSYERILSGDGLYTLYEFLAETDFAPEPLSMLERSKEKDPNAMVSHGALEEGDALCLEALRLFVEIYAAEAGNLALKSMALGGVYIGGGIAPKILPMMQKENFMNVFKAKGRLEGMLSKVPVRVALNQETALLGAANFAKDKFSS